MRHDVVEMIQAMLAPGIMISACGLLLLGMNNKYSLVVNRIRLLDDEKRRLHLVSVEKELELHEQQRLSNITLQIKLFYFRIKLVRNAVLSYSLAVAFFILTSFGIGLSQFETIDFAPMATVLFLCGMFAVFGGVLFAAREIVKGYKIVTIEVNQ